MAATTKAIVESLPGAPASAATTGSGQTVSGPAVADSAGSLLVSSDSAPVATAPIALTVASQGDSLAMQPVAPAAAPGVNGFAAPQPTITPAMPVTTGMPVATPAAVTPAPPMVKPPASPPANPPAPASASLSLAPIVPQGRTDLAAGMFAVRVGDTVTVYFDTPEARTRRPEKFEQIVRATLPRVHGGAATALLGTIASGALIGAVDLVNELPVRGLHLRGTDGRTLSLWPETRPGRDGPLVVAYRATPTP